MIEVVDATQFHNVVSSGKTKPARLVCEGAEGQSVELIVKLSGACERGVVNLSSEAIGACLAADLGLPVPRPYLVKLDPEFVDEIPDEAWREQARKSSTLAFGSTVVPSGFRQWTTADRLSVNMVPEAAAIFAFDALTSNPDRRVSNPNCFVRGDALRVFDHELSFSHGLVLFWRPPWELGGLQSLETEGAHIFRAELRGKALDLDPIRRAWANISDEKIDEYRASLPDDWGDGTAFVAAALSLVSDVRENIDGCLAEIARVLT